MDLEGLELTAVAAGTRMRLRVKAGARKSAIVGVHGGALKLSVTAPAERGKANAAVVDLLAARLTVAPSTIEVVSGHTTQDKVVVVPLGQDIVAQRLRLPAR